jgi:hypothetical protein
MYANLWVIKPDMKWSESNLEGYHLQPAANVKRRAGRNSEPCSEGFEDAGP